MAAPAALEEARTDTASAPLALRIAAIGRSLIGADYAPDPEGEGLPPDPDPTLRFDVFDCITFVEVVLAYALGRDDLEVADIRYRLRYGDGPVQYENRNHLIELQWLPDAVRNGLLSESTHMLTDRTVTVPLAISLNTWNAWKGRAAFAMTDSQLPIGAAEIRVIRAGEALAQIANIPPGSVLLPVRSPRNWRPVLTFHAGFVVADPRGPRLLHATKLGDGAVRDDSLAWYLEHLTTYPWPVEGVAIYTPVERDDGSTANPGPTRDGADSLTE